MIKVEAVTLEAAYTKASQELDCSITELNFEVIQQPKSGFLGLWKKTAIIVATCKPVQNTNETKTVTQKEYKKPNYEKPKQKLVEREEVVEKTDNKKVSSQQKSQGVLDSFYSENKIDTPMTQILATDSVIEYIRKDLNKLFGTLCFDIDPILVSRWDDNTIYVTINGKDAALLIGKDGYRYKAISYLIFNWINPKYGLSLRLEIAEFLKNQEEIIYKYIETLREKIDANGKAQTKPLDGILIHIALNRLRELYPNKYVGIKLHQDKRFILINDFNQ